VIRFIAVFIFFICASYSAGKQREIKALEEKIATLELEIANSEVNSQGQMFEEWHAYAETLEQIQQKEKNLKDLREKLQKLKSENP
jgi:protein subunit release factor A